MERPDRPLSFILSYLLCIGWVAAVVGLVLAKLGFGFGPQLILAGMAFVIAGFGLIFLPGGIIDMERGRGRLAIFSRLVFLVEALISDVIRRPIAPGLPPPRLFLTA